MRSGLGMYCDKSHFHEGDEAPSHFCPYAQEFMKNELEQFQKCTCCKQCTQQCQDDI